MTPKHRCAVALATCGLLYHSAGEDWFKSRKPDILAMNPLANLPYLVDGETCICQTRLDGS